MTMGGKDMIRMSMRELKRLKVLQEPIDGHITQKTAASMLGLSERQPGRLAKAAKEEGDRGVIHKSRGLPSKRRICDRVKEKAVSLTRTSILALALCWPVRSCWRRTA